MDWPNISQAMYPDDFGDPLTPTMRFTFVVFQIVSTTVGWIEIWHRTFTVKTKDITLSLNCTLYLVLISKC